MEELQVRIGEAEQHSEFAHDLTELTQSRLRDTMSSELLSEHRDLVKLETPKPVGPNIEYLRQAVHSMDIVPEGMSIVEYVDQLRRADEERV